MAVAVAAGWWRWRRRWCWSWRPAGAGGSVAERNLCRCRRGCGCRIPACRCGCWCGGLAPPAQRRGLGVLEPPGPFLAYPDLPIPRLRRCRRPKAPAWPLRRRLGRHVEMDGSDAHVPNRKAAHIDGMPPGVGVTEADGRCLMMLLDMGRHVTSTIGHEYNFESIDDVSKLRDAYGHRDESDGKMWSYWHHAPSGPGVYEMVLDWCRSQPGSTSSPPPRAWSEATVADDGGAAPPRPPSSSAGHAARDRRLLPGQGGERRCGDPRRRGHGGVQGARHLHRSAALQQCALPACLGPTLPFMGSIVYDGTIKGMSMPPNRQVELDATVADAERDGKVVAVIPPPVEAPLEGIKVRITAWWPSRSSTIRSRPWASTTPPRAGTRCGCPQARSLRSRAPTREYS